MPLAPSGTTTRLGAVFPGTKLRFDAGLGRATPDGQTVAKPAAVGLVSVTFNATAVAFPGTPGTARSRVCPADHGVENPPVPTRESRMRLGLSGSYGMPPGAVPSP